MRLSLALSQGAVTLPETGRVLLMRPPGDLDLSALSLERLVAYAPFKPDHDALLARGVQVEPVAEDVAAAIVFVPRSKVLARDMVARACAAVKTGGTVIVDGDKTDGVESILKECRKIADVGDAYSKAHGKTFAFGAPAVPPKWRTMELEADGWLTRPGVFSADGVDPGSALLAEALPPLRGKVCDLGGGWGYLSAMALRASPKIAALDMIEAEAEALSSAEVNVDDPRAVLHWADATTWRGGPYDAILCNPPFHPSRKADPGLGRAFIATAAAVLAPKGSAWFVANRHLPYEAALHEAFDDVTVHQETRGYKVIEAKRPKGKRK